jgi:hypothetical protein
MDLVDMPVGSSPDSDNITQVSNWTFHSLLIQRLRTFKHFATQRGPRDWRQLEIIAHCHYGLIPVSPPNFGTRFIIYIC